jgi:hypothetical protein
MRHGLLAATIVLKDEEVVYFQQYLDQHIERFQPFDAVEMNVIEEMVGAAWRGRRSAGMQTIILDTQFPDSESSARDAQEFLDSFNKLAASPALALLHRYELHYHRIYHHCIHTLLKLQKTRPERAAEPGESAVPNEPKPASAPVAQPPSPPPTPISPVPNEPKPAAPWIAEMPPDRFVSPYSSRPTKPKENN